MLSLLIEALIHGWDLAVSSGQNCILPKRESEQLYKLALKNHGKIRGAGVYGKEKIINQNDDLQTKLLALFGRDNNIST